MKKMIILAALVVTTGAFWMAFNASAQDTSLPPDPEATIDEPLPFIQDDDMPDGPPCFCRLDMFKEELGLSDEQLNKLEYLRFDHMKAQIELGAKVRVATLELTELMKTRGNDDAVLKKSAELTALRSQMADQMIKHQLQRRAIFTDEQWVKVRTLTRAGFMKMRHGGRGMHPGTGMHRSDRFDDRARFARPNYGRRLNQ